MSEDLKGVYYTPKEQAERDAAMNTTDLSLPTAALTRTVLNAEAQAEARLGYCQLLEIRLEARHSWAQELEKKVLSVEDRAIKAEDDLAHLERMEVQYLDQINKLEDRVEELTQATHPDLALLQTVADLRKELEARTHEAEFNKSQWDRYYKEFTDETLARAMDVSDLSKKIDDLKKQVEGLSADVFEADSFAARAYELEKDKNAILVATISEIKRAVFFDTDITQARRVLQQLRDMLVTK